MRENVCEYVCEAPVSEALEKQREAKTKATQEYRANGDAKEVQEGRQRRALRQKRTVVKGPASLQVDAGGLSSGWAVDCRLYT